VKRKANTRKPHVPQTYSEAQLSGLRTSTSARKQATVERLRTALETLTAKKQAVTVQSIYEECGLRYAAIHRNPEALALFRANSTHLQEQKPRTKRKRQTADIPSSPRDSLLNYKKPQLVERLRTAQQQLQTVEQQHSVLAAAYLERETRIVELEARLAELEPYRAFVEQVRSRIRQEEHGDNSSPAQL
jgi:hypothetical protein